MIRETAYNTVFDAQTHFRLLMDSMARPGKIYMLNGVAINPPRSLNRASALIGLALLNADVTFFASRSPDDIADYLRTNTASRPADAPTADFLFLSGIDDPTLIDRAQTGSLSYPETGASVIIDVTAVSDQPLPANDLAQILTLHLTGPGIKTTQTVFINGLNPALLDSVRKKNAEYPLGIDLILADADDRVICLPRTTKIAVHHHQSNKWDTLL